MIFSKAHEDDLLFKSYTFCQMTALLARVTTTETESWEMENNFIMKKICNIHNI